ncbi:TraR/DksA C4-type zinc finger protein [Nocardia sp. NRRL S-836]|uniref:TraR/DksA family transcriptional regulator n=1 Tax=Nocardia sp. NRRL S-836 TaxID=1519492 RepID=UPI0012FCC499|nr:TraR/DksA C4-type zinc finger protein [Nocardia sp. NRRL S-836]
MRRAPIGAERDLRRRGACYLRETAQRNRVIDHLPALKERLERERAFRIEQLAELDASASQPGDHALREVTDQITAAARIALTDIEIALLRIDIGSYGRCQTCHADIPFRLLEAIPQLRRCPACQHDGTSELSRRGRPLSRRRHRARASARRGSPTAAQHRQVCRAQ